MIRWIAHTSLRKKRVLVRVDFNVPLSRGRITNDFRIRAHLPTIRLLLRQNNVLILFTHIGNPDGKRVTELSAKPVAMRLAKLLGEKVVLLKNPFSRRARRKIQNAPPRSIFLSENIRFWPGEKKNDPRFAKRLAALGDAFVQDAFGEIHRPYATMIGIPRFLPAFGGALLQKELDALRPIAEKPARPFVILMGGAKVSTKLPYLKGFLRRADRILLGGALANTALKARGVSIGTSLFEKKEVPTMRKIARRAKKLRLPVDVAVAPSAASSHTAITPVGAIGPHQAAFDIGPRTARAFIRELRRARTILWNGPLGLIEVPRFRRGTIAVARALLHIRAYKVSGGGDLIGILQRHHLLRDFNHIATGGGATLALVAGMPLPGLTALNAPHNK